MWRRPTSPYEQLIIYQMFVAFGHGVGGLWMRRNTCRALHRYCLWVLRHPKNEKKVSSTTDPWKEDRHGTQVLLRFNAIGRLAARRAVEQGLTDVQVEDLHAAALLVMEASIESMRKKLRKRGKLSGDATAVECAWCPDPNGEPPMPSIEELEEPDDTPLMSSTQLSPSDFRPELSDEPS